MSSNETTQYINYLNSVSNGLSYYYLFIIFPIGLIGNAVSFYIYTRPNLNRKTNTGFLYAWLCIANVLSILQYIFLTRSSILFNYSLNNWPCGLINFLRRSTFNWVAWMNVYVSFDRFISVYYPTKVALFSKKLVLYGIMFGLVTLIAVTSITNLISWPIPPTFSCYVSANMNAASSIIAFLMRVCIPYILMATLNGLVISRLKRSRQRVAVAVTTNLQLKERQHKMSNKEYKFTKATLLMDFVFLGMHLPVAAWLAMAVVDTFTNDLSGDPLTKAIYNFFSNLAQLLAFSYSSAGIFMFVAFNYTFKNELINLLGLRRIFPNLTEIQTQTQNNSIINQATRY